MTYDRYRFSFGYGLTPVIKKLIIIMAALFFCKGSSAVESISILELYLFSSEKILLLATLHLHFLHVGFLTSSHLLALWMFGGELESYWGSGKFLRISSSVASVRGSARSFFSPYQVILVSGLPAPFTESFLAVWLAFFQTAPSTCDFIVPTRQSTLSSFLALLSFIVHRGKPEGALPT